MQLVVEVINDDLNFHVTKVGFGVEVHPLVASVVGRDNFVRLLCVVAGIQHQQLVFSWLEHEARC